MADLTPLPPLSSTTPNTGSPQFIGQENTSALSSVLSKASQLTGLFRDVLIRHFADPENIEAPALQSYIWSNNERTGIIIDSSVRFDPRLTQKRPAVIIKRHAFRYWDVGMGGGRLQAPPADCYGHPHFSSFWIGSHTLFAIASNGAQAEALSTEVARELTQFGQLILQEALLLRFRVMEVGEIAQLEEHQSNFVVPISVGYAFQESWVVRQQAPTLKRISLATVLNC